MGWDESWYDRGYAGLNLHYRRTQQQVNRALADWKDEKKVSDIVICDRCQSFGKGDAAGILTLTRKPRANDEDHQLCPACITDFDDFWAVGMDRQLTPRDGQAFTEPWQPASSETEAEQSRLVRLVAREFAAATAQYRETPTVDELITRIRQLEAGKGDTSNSDAG